MYAIFDFIHLLLPIFNFSQTHKPISLLTACPIIIIIISSPSPVSVEQMQIAVGSSTRVWTAYQQICLQRKLILPSSAAITQYSSLARGGGPLAFMLEFWLAWICAVLMEGSTTAVNLCRHQPRHVQDSECHSSQPIPQALTISLPTLPQCSLKHWWVSSYVWVKHS